MSQCKGKTKSGDQCKLDAQPDSDFCHLHGAADEGGEQADECVFELEDLMPIAMAGAMLVGIFVLAKTIGKWMPK